MAVLSTDLRERVLNAYELMGNKSKVCRHFNIARSTLDDWIKLKTETGQLEQPQWRRGPAPKLQNLQAFQHFVEHTEFQTLKQLLPLYQQHFGESISYSGLRRAMQRIDWKSFPEKTSSEDAQH
ncbi:transposase [Acinetobacter calcoaceticus]|uniref:Transposase n=1 Tax=Acinetobacter calcoaceticus TaxID=471 RepID=A0A4R1XZC7_ACICA|nr:transposase [Acinetobacter calcoaceticus]